MKRKVFVETGALICAAVIFFAQGGIPASAQEAGAAALANLQANAKLTRPDDLLADFVAGRPETAVIVHLQPTAEAQALAAQSRLSARVPAEFTRPGAPTYYNLEDESIRNRLKTTVSEAVGRAIDRLGTAGVTVTQRFSYQFGFAARVTPEALERIINAPDVLSVEKDAILQAQLAQGIPLMNAAAARATYTGAGLSIAICDTGIDTSHPRLGGGGFPNAKVIGGYDTGDNDADPRPGSAGEAHGTACAGIAAGSTGTVGDYIGGVAPEAKLYAVKISFGTGGSAYDSAMIAGWEWCITHKNDDPANPILVISTSFGGGRFYSTCDAASPGMTTAAANAVAAGITIFASSGNDSFCNSMGWPACISYVNSVGAVFDGALGTFGFCVDPAETCAAVTPHGGCATGYLIWNVTAADKVTSYSNSASFLTLFAPSHNAYTADIVGTGGYTSGDYSTNFGGTSAACPYAAGSAAVLQSAAKARACSPLTPAAVTAYLVGNGDNVTDGKVAITKPRVNVGNAVDALPHTVLTVTSSNPASGVMIGVSPNDVGGQGEGSTGFTRSYNCGAEVTLTAPLTAGGSPFGSWSGCSSTLGEICYVTMDAPEKTVTVHYENRTPTLGSVTPSALTSAPEVAQSFSAVYSDADGFANLRRVFLLINTTATGANGISLVYSKAVNRLYLYDDAGTTTVGSCIPGGAGSLSNSRGTLNCAATTVAGSANDLTVKWNITPSAAFESVTKKNLYLYARDLADATVGWADRGDWTVTSTNVAPNLGSVTPAALMSAPSVAQNLSALYSDADGFANLKKAYLLVNTTAVVANGIWVMHDRMLNKLYLADNAGTGYVGNCTPGAAGSLSNSQGTLDCAATTVAGSGNDLTVNWRITPSVAFESATKRNIYLLARDAADASAGWTDKGDWTVKSTNEAPTLGSVTPAALTSAPAVAQSFSAVYSDGDGYANIRRAFLLVNATATGVDGISLIHDRTVNKLYLYDDAGTAPVGNCTPGQAGTLSNSQGTLNCAATTVTGSGNDLTVNWNITPTAAFASATKKQLFLYARDLSDATAGWTIEGEWTVKETNEAPTLLSVSPSGLVSEPSVARNFAAVYSDPDGFSNLKRVFLLVNTPATGVGAISLILDRTLNKLYLVNDTGTATVGSCTPGAPGTLSNGQGMLDCGATTVAGLGSDLTVNWSITPSVAFASATKKNLYLYARDMSDATAGYTDMGDWTITY